MLLAILAVASVVLSGCGQKTIDKGAFRREVGSLSSSAAEAALVADLAADGESLSITTRSRMQEISTGVNRTSVALGQATHPSSLDKQVARALTLAESIERQTLRLYRDPGNKQLAREIHQRMETAADDASKLEDAG
jgi:hypothetical protein